MAITLNQIRYFCEVAEAGHFGRAAERLHISQPPLSRQIASLEAALGSRLFIRSAKGVVVTATGKQFLQDSRKILLAVKLAEQNAGASSKGMTGSLLVGFTSCAAYSITPLIAKRFRLLYPDVDLTLREFLPSVLEVSVRDGTLDAGISFPETDTEALTSQTLIQEPLEAAIPSTHRLAKKHRLRMEDLAREPFIVAPRSASPSLFDTILGRCLAANFQPRIVLEAHLQQTIVNFVAEGLGVALVPRSMERSRLSGVCFKAIAEPPMIEQRLIWAKGNSNPCITNLRILCNERGVITKA